MTDRLRVVCLIPAMRAGGAERVMAGLCNALASAGDEVTLITLAPEAEMPFFPLAPEVRLMPLDRLNKDTGLSRLCSLAGRLFDLRKAVRTAEPDVVLSFLDTMNITAVLVTRFLGVPVVVSERIDPGAYLHRIGRFKSALRRLTYPWADRLVVQTARAGNFFTWMAPSRLTVLPNPVPQPELTAAPDRPDTNGHFRIVAVGRLDDQKGFDLLIEAFALIAGDYPDWDLRIIGEGDERAALQQRIGSAGLSDRVGLPGVTKDIGAEYGGANLMVLSSRYEGFPNVLAEAMAAGLPAVAFRGVSGVDELIVHGECGWLADEMNAPGLAAAMARLTDSPDLRRRLGAAAMQRVATLSPEEIFGRWRMLLLQVASQGRNN
ncbi:glycosyltransferase family 4 protein [Thalassospiraceae bacterium LMO-JJ14]|nr:glycosyltransferase family 4 protein [Thalassospiraceae bacterium LMO-JJ14]